MSGCWQLPPIHLVLIVVTVRFGFCGNLTNGWNAVAIMIISKTDSLQAPHI